MKICLAFFPIMDMGGLTNNNSNLAAGLTALGHTTKTLLFMPRATAPRNGVAGGRASLCPHTGFTYDQMRSYTWPADACVPYRGAALPKAIELLNSFDLVIWQIPVPTKKKENAGNADWVELYRQTMAPQVAYIHDGNFVDGYPWLARVAPFLKGVGCVNHAAYNSASQLSVPYSLAPSPQAPMALPDTTKDTYEARIPGFVSLQTFKAWKHVPELVEAIPYMSKTTHKYLAGKGIDYHYLTSKTKSKWPGRWDAAVEAGMDYLGVISNDQRDWVLQSVTCLIDPSWSKKYATIGGHYNRVAVEAIRRGALPIVRPLGISTNLQGQGEIFKVGINCVAIPQNVTPQEYAEYVDCYCNLPYKDYLPLIENGLDLLPLWDRKIVAQTFINLSKGIAEKMGNTSATVRASSDKAMEEFFNG